MSFKVGDLCVWTDDAGGSVNPLIAGHECTILRVVDTPNGEYEVECPTYPSDIPSGLWCAFRNQLRKKDEPQSDFTAGDWELCPWQPYKKREMA
jgi:hypothetical protein